MGKSEIGTIIDSSIEDFVLVAKNKSFSELNVLKKALEMEYCRTELVKNKLLEELVNPAEDIMISSVLSDLYKVMQIIEDKATICVKLMEEKRPK